METHHHTQRPTAGKPTSHSLSHRPPLCLFFSADSSFSPPPPCCPCPPPSPCPRRWPSCSGQWPAAPCDRSPEEGGWGGFRPGPTTCSGGPSPGWQDGRSFWEVPGSGCCRPTGSVAPSWCRASPAAWWAGWWRAAASAGSSTGWSVPAAPARMNKLYFFYEGSGEDSRSFYIQPSPMRETTVN